MHLRRALTYLNLSIAAALVILLCLAYWFAWRPLPQTSGLIDAPVESAVSISRDALGVPHITARNVPDALFAQGFATAQDRFWQMDLLRRLAAGEMAEVLGEAAVESDRESRRLRMPRIAEESYANLPAEDRTALAAYARGVNYYLETHRDRLPLEFTLLRYDPRPWSPTDSILAALQMARTLTSSWRADIQKKKLLDGGDAEKVAFLFPSRTGMEIQPGSNAWAVSGSRSANGHALVANDPHLEFSIPSVWYMVHLAAPGLNVTGVSLPGLPCVVIGHNDRIAWGVTNLEFDVQDIYFEKLDSSTGRYLDSGRTAQARPEREVIRVKGSSPIEFVNWVTRHGPVFAVEGNQMLSLRWIAADTSVFRFPFLDLNRARNWPEFKAALSRLSVPSSNFVYADRDGNIGYQVAGKLPIRRSFAGDVPADGSTGAYEWEGYIPFGQLPSVFNPPSGLVVTANQNPFPADFPYRVGGKFAPPYRSNQIRARLLARKHWRPDEMLRLQTDLYSEFHHFLARETVAAYDRRGARNPSLERAIDLLRGWNGQMEAQRAAPLIVTLQYQHLRKAVAERASPGKGLSYDYPMAPAAIELLLRSRPVGWFQDYGQLLLRSLVDAVEEGRRIQGDDVNRWEYGRYNALVLNHPMGGHLAVVGKYFNIGWAPMSGAPTTVQQSRGIFGPSMRMVAEPADWERSLMNIAIGQSGHVLSRHYKDQWNEYRAGRSFRMQFGKIEAEEVLRFRPLIPGR